MASITGRSKSKTTETQPAHGGFLSQAASLAQTISRKCADAKARLSHRAEDISWEFQAGFDQQLAKWLLGPNEDGNNYGFKLNYHDRSGCPWDTHIIRAHTNFGSTKACQRALLEALALKMSNAERRTLLEAEGSQFADRDALYRAIRKVYPVIPRDHEASVYYVLQKQAFYRASECGSLIRLQFIYEIIRANPPAFCQLLLAK
jgi:hypothetical protein